MYTVTGLLVTPPTVAVTCTALEVLDGVQIVKSGIPPWLLRFQLPAQMTPVGLMSAFWWSDVPYVGEPVLSELPRQLVAEAVPICAD
jgi:hypothetical protein